MKRSTAEKMKLIKGAISSSAATPAHEKELMAFLRSAVADSKRIDLLQEEIVDVIYLADGFYIDVRGGSLRKSLDAFKVFNDKLGKSSK